MKTVVNLSLIPAALLLLTMFTAGDASAQMCPALDLRTQAEVDAVFCTSVAGGVTISSNASGSDITNIDSLSRITSIGGALWIIDNDFLQDLDGLSGLNTVGGWLLIENNPLLTGVDGLSELVSVGQVFHISFNDSLTNLDGLSNLVSVGGKLDIHRNPALDQFCGLYTLINGNGLGGLYQVRNNLANPTQAQILTTSCNWTPWVSRDLPGGSGDWELSFLVPNVCSTPVDIQARVVGTAVVFSPGNATPNVLSVFNRQQGLACRNFDQPGGIWGAGCLNYEIRFLCP